jgi:hypothetical protein
MMHCTVERDSEEAAGVSPVTVYFLSKKGFFDVADKGMP